MTVKSTALMFMALVVCVLGLLYVFRPYSIDLLRYGWWRVFGPGFEKGEVRSGSADISFAVTGKGPALMLLHGGLSSSLDWYATVPSFSRFFRVVLVDSRGHGSSTLGTTELSYDVLARDALAVLNHLDIRQANVLGWSDGGNVGLLLALHHPERVSRLVAISANVHPDGLTESAIAGISDIDVHKPSWFSRMLYRWQSPEHQSLGRLRDQVTSMWTGTHLLTDDELKRIDVPTLLVIGEYDDVALEHAEKMQRLMSGATLLIVPDVAHNVPQAAAQWVLDHSLAHFRAE